MKKGAFITIYGINNIGKSTHAQILTERLINEGYDAEFLKYPNYTVEPTGPFLDHLLRGHEKQPISEEELQLWFVLNRYQFQPEIERKLAEGKVLVVEDYIGTGISWGVAKGLKLEWMEAINKHLMKEDLAVYMSGHRHMQAKEAKHIHEQDDELAERCRRVHEKLAKKYKWKKVQMQHEIHDTAALMWGEVEKFLKSR